MRMNIRAGLFLFACISMQTAAQPSENVISAARSVATAFNASAQGLVPQGYPYVESRMGSWLAIADLNDNAEIIPRVAIPSMDYLINFALKLDLQSLASKGIILQDLEKDSHDACAFEYKHYLIRFPLDDRCLFIKRANFLYIVQFNIGEVDDSTIWIPYVLESRTGSDSMRLGLLITIPQGSASNFGQARREVTGSTMTPNEVSLFGAVAKTIRCNGDIYEIGYDALLNGKSLNIRSVNDLDGSLPIGRLGTVTLGENEGLVLSGMPPYFVASGLKKQGSADESLHANLILTEDRPSAVPPFFLGFRSGVLLLVPMDGRYAIELIRDHGLMMIPE